MKCIILSPKGRKMLNNIIYKDIGNKFYQSLLVDCKMPYISESNTAIIVVQLLSIFRLFVSLQHARIPCPSLFPEVLQTHVH